MARQFSMMTSIGSLPGTFGSGLSDPVMSPSFTPLYVESTLAAQRSDTGTAVSAAIADSPFNISRLFILNPLENQPRRELHLPRRRVARAGNRAERGASELAVRVLEIGDIGEVVDLVADLQPCTRAGRKLLEHRQIDSPLRRSVQHDRRRIAEGEERLRLERVGIEPACDRPLVCRELGITDEVRSIGSLSPGRRAAGIGSRCEIKDAERLAGLVIRDRVDLPAGERSTRKTGE